MICEYALNQNNELVFIDDVENGEKCNCTCPSCGEKMIAKNNGKIKDHHFAHSSGSDCEGYRETLLHIWSKQIIEESKEFTIPKYKNLSTKKLKFSSVKIEQRNDTNFICPDIVGITDEGLELLIEIFVTHKCSEEKIKYIKENKYNCIEVKIPEEIETKEELYEFLVNSDDSDFKYFINYPYGDKFLKYDACKNIQEINKYVQIDYRPFIKDFIPIYLIWKKNGINGITAYERRREFKLFENLNHKGLPYSKWPENWKQYKAKNNENVIS